MGVRKLIFGLFALSLIGAGVGYFLSDPYTLGICESSVFCYELVTRSFALFYGSGALAIIFAILLAVPQAFAVWKKFAIWFVPIAALIFIFYQEPSSGDFISPYPETLFRWIAALYVLVSIVIISMHALKSQNKQSNNR